MRRKTFLAVWFSAPLLPIAVYGLRLGSVVNGYFLSVALGLAAYTWFCGLLVLNSKPAYALKALGPEGLATLMAKTPILILGLSVLHRILKIGLFAYSGPESLPRSFLASLGVTLKRGMIFGVATTENVLGFLLLLLFLVFSFLGLLYLQKKPGPGSLWGRLRDRIFSAGEWTAWGNLVLYIGTTGIAILALVHILSASSTSFAANPAGAILLLGELAYGLFSWLGARIREGWKAPLPGPLRGKAGPRA